MWEKLLHSIIKANEESKNKETKRVNDPQWFLFKKEHLLFLVYQITSIQIIRHIHPIRINFMS